MNEDCRMKLIKLTSPLPCIYFQSFVSVILAYMYKQTNKIFGSWVSVLNTCANQHMSNLSQDNVSYLQ